jgi:prevent-host-death family protein
MNNPQTGPVTIPVHEAKSTLSRLLKRAAAGETIYIGAYGKPEAKLVAAKSQAEEDAEKRKKAWGCMKDKMWVADDFDAPLPDELLEAFGYDLSKPEIPYHLQQERKK